MTASVIVAQSESRLVEMYIFAALVYFVICFTFSFMIKKIQNRKLSSYMIELKNVSKWYGEFQVLNNCSVKIEKKDVMVICGPSGSGKSTLIKCVNGLERYSKR